MKEIEGSSMVEHPAHYVSGKYECISVMKDVFGEEALRHFCLLNAFKYLWRSERKGGEEDLEKASYYLQVVRELKEMK